MKLLFASTVTHRGSYLLVGLQASFVFLLLAGGVSTERIGIVGLGPLGELRFSLLFLLGFAAAMVVGLRRAPFAASRAFWTFIAILSGVHGWVLASWGWSGHPPQSVIEAYEVSLLCGTLVVGIVLFSLRPRDGVLVLALTTYVLAMLLIAAQLISGGVVAGELALLGAGGIGTGRLMAMAVVSATYLMFVYGRIAWLMPVPLMVIAILMSGSRAALVGLVLSLGVLLWKRRTIQVSSASRIRGWRALVMALVTLAGMSVLFGTTGGRDLILKFVVAGFFTQDGASAGSLYLADRDVIFVDAFLHSLREPVFGFGIGSYLGPFGEVYPHNLLLSYAIDAGWIAAGLVGLLLAAGLICLLRSRDPVLGILGAFAVLQLVPSMLSGSYLDARVLWMLLLLGLLAHDELRIAATNVGLASGAGRLALRTQRLVAPCCNPRQSNN
jgi:hypothetical protein